VVILFDSSVLIAAMISEHAHHTESLKWLQKVREKKIEGAVSAHTLAECFSVLTRLPINPAIPPALAWRLIQENILASFQVVDLSVRDYRQAISRLAESNLRGGLIYDALIIQSAKKKGISRIMTWNLGDFERIAEVGIEIVRPE
jgi:predicted nucleic acid-binding protein